MVGTEKACLNSRMFQNKEGGFSQSCIIRPKSSSSKDPNKYDFYDYLFYDHKNCSRFLEEKNKLGILDYIEKGDVNKEETNPSQLELILLKVENLKDENKFHNI